MTIDEIFAEWEQDSKISIQNLAEESLRIPLLHSKYYRMLSTERMRVKKVEADIIELKRLKFEYYSGSLDEQTLKDKGWKPFRHKILKADIATYIESDQEIIQMNLRLSVANEKIDILDSIIKTVANRSFQINAAINFLKYRDGVV